MAIIQYFIITFLKFYFIRDNDQSNMGIQLPIFLLANLADSSSLIHSLEQEYNLKRYIY